MLNKLLEDGNTLYRKNRFDEAAHRYQYALRRLPQEASTPQETANGDSNADNASTLEQLNIHLLLNLSRCKRKQGDFKEAVTKASEALALKPGCLEALHSRARAYREDERFEEAIKDLTEALKMSPQNREIHKFMIKVKEEWREARNNNDDDDAGGKLLLLPIGSNDCERIKYFDDSSSVATLDTERSPSASGINPGASARTGAPAANV